MKHKIFTSTLFALFTVVFVSSPAVAAGVDAEAAKALAKRNDCFKCHAVDKTKKGPSYQKIAAKFKGKADAESYIAGKIKSGGSGVWGAIPMPAQDQLKEADAKAIAKWIVDGAK